MARCSWPTEAVCPAPGIGAVGGLLGASMACRFHSRTALGGGRPAHPLPRRQMGVAQDRVRHRVEPVADGDGEAREGLLITVLRPSG